LAKLIQGTVCKILNREEIKPHKVRYYLERRDAEFARSPRDAAAQFRPSPIGRTIPSFSLTQRRRKE